MGIQINYIGIILLLIYAVISFTYIKKKVKKPMTQMLLMMLNSIILTAIFQQMFTIL